MPKTFNKRKIEILEVIASGGKTAKQVVSALDVDIDDEDNNDTKWISSYLVKYREQGLLTASKSADDGRKYIYALTKQGRKRLVYLKQ